MVIEREYPVQLGIAYLFVVGYVIRTLFVAARLPAAVGVIFSGFFFSYFFQEEILDARDLLQQLAFFLVLLTAGLEITLNDLKPYMFVMAMLPAFCEIVTIAAYAKVVKDWSLVEGLVMGVVLTAIGDGLVIPKMKEFWVKFKSHPLPRLVFCWAPLEASFCLTLFGILVGASAPADAPDVSLTMMVGANILRIVATLAMGALLGYTSGHFIPKRESLTVNGQQVFSGSSVEAFLMVLSVALFAYGLGEEEGGNAFIPMPKCGGSLFQPELLVILTGTFFSAAANHEVKHEVEGILGGVWVFGQLVLFSMLGSKTNVKILPQVTGVLPIMACGLAARFCGVATAISLTVGQRGCTCAKCVQSRRDAVPYDTLFCFLSTVPRATIQGALGAVPVTEHFFQHYPHKHESQAFIFTAARLYIICTAIVGMVLLNTIGPLLLLRTSEIAVECEHSKTPLVVVEEHVDLYAANEFRSGMAKQQALEVIADRYGIEAKLVAGMLQKSSQLRAAGQPWQPPESEVEHLRQYGLGRRRNSDLNWETSKSDFGKGSLFQFEARPVTKPPQESKAAGEPQQQAAGFDGARTGIGGALRRLGIPGMGGGSPAARSGAGPGDDGLQPQAIRTVSQGSTGRIGSRLQLPTARNLLPGVINRRGT